MSMSPRDWQDLAGVYQAGADSQRGYAYNTERQQQADALEAMAARCEEIAFERNMTDEQQADARRARRQRRVPLGSRARCRETVPVPGEPWHGKQCSLHRDHVQDGTAHQPAPVTEPRTSLLGDDRP